MAKKSKQAAIVAAQRKPIPLLDLDTVVAPEFSQGKYRSFLVTGVPETVTSSRAVSMTEYAFLGALLVGSVFVRLNNLEHPKSVVFDEVHFGGYAKKYILGTFFMDVHPPLAKMLFAAVGLLGGFTGDFDFANIGDAFPKTVPYVLMRAFPAVLGVATVFLCYLTLRSSGVRPAVAFLTASCLLVENSYVTISRYILLDAPLLFFIAAAIYAFKKFEVQQPFTVAWYRALLSCAVALGLAFSSKWVGLFTIAWVGLCCAAHMWFIIGDLKVSTPAVVHHAVARASFLLGVPVVLYLFMFSVHFNILTKDGDGAAFMTSAFRAGLDGTTVPQSTTAQVAFGSVVTLRHVNTRGGYLHSHNHFYETGSKQQQITLYPHLDSNNDWLIEPYNTSMPETFTPIRDGTKVRLQHVVSKRRLHSHDEKPPVSERDWQKEASCYGYEGFGGDANDDWIFEIVKHKSAPDAQEDVHALETVFRLKHAMTGHYLFSSEVKLPAWAFEQQEVTAASQGARPLTYWYIETNDVALDDAERKTVLYPKLSFWQKFVESHKTMWNINQGLTSHHKWQSSPQDWPLMVRGINYWARDHTQVYLMGNPVVWWAASASLLAFVIHVAISVVKWQTGSTIASSKNVFNFNLQMFGYFSGWALHYLPFFIMGRQLFLHHYLPSQYFAILGLGHFFDLLVSCSKNLNRSAYIGLTAFVAASAVVYSLYSPLSYASQWTKSQCLAVKALDSWDFDCNTFLENSEAYASYSVTAPPAKPPGKGTTIVKHEAKETTQAAQLALSEFDEEETFEAPPPPETHTGPLPAHLRGDDEEIPAGEMVDEATGKGEDVPVVAAAVESDEESEAVAEKFAEPAAEPLETVLVIEVSIEGAEAVQQVVKPVEPVDPIVAVAQPQDAEPFNQVVGEGMVAEGVVIETAVAA